MDQLKLDSFADLAKKYPDAPGHRGVDTSIAAAMKIAPRLNAMQEKILAHIRAAGGLGATADECAIATGIDIVTARARVTELKAKLLIRPTDERRATASGNLARVMRIMGA